MRKRIFTSLLVIFIGLFQGFSTPVHASVANWQKGISIVPKNTTDYSSSTFKQSLTNLASTGANYVTLVIPYYQSSLTSTDLAAGWNTPTDQSLTDAITTAHNLGLKVNLKMHVEVSSGDWRAWIDPTDRHTWFANYSNILNHYGDIGKQTGIEEMTIGAELYKLTSTKVNSANTGYWNTTISSLRTHFSGLLTYSAQHTNPTEENEIEFWDKLDYIGISAYFPLNSGDLTGSWDSWNNSILLPLHNRWNKDILFTEVGYRSVNGAVWDPWDSDRGGYYDPTEQSNDYQALMAYWDQKSYMVGVHWWDWSSDPNIGGPGNIDYTPYKKPAQNVLSQWYGKSSVSFDIFATNNPTNPSPGSQVQSQINLKPVGGSLADAHIDIEVYDSSNQRVFQQIFSNQNIVQGTAQNYTVTWTASSSDKYVLKVGVFNNNWSLLKWHDQVASLDAIYSVALTSSSSSPTSTTTLNLWWPSGGASLNGVQSFKLNVTEMSPDKYDAFWQVDSGSLNVMGDSQTDYPHKEALVDVNPWSWKGTGPYTLTFVIKDKSGTVLTQKSADITISH